MDSGEILDTIADRLNAAQRVLFIREESLDRWPLVVITGGEPFRQHLGYLIGAILNDGYEVQIETNGSLRPSFCAHDDAPWKYRTKALRMEQFASAYIVVSPKTGKVHDSVWDNACCVKYVGDHTNLSEVDGLPTKALEHPNLNGLARPPHWWRRPIYLQPTDFSQMTEVMSQQTIQLENDYALNACLKSCMKYGYILQLQTHKILGVP